MTALTPAFKITVEDKELPTIVTNRLISVRLFETRGDEADQLDITLDDSDGKLKMPPKGAKIGFALGWKGKPLVDKGLFTVAGISHTGAPDQLVIRAKSANLVDTFKQLKDRSYHETTLGAVIAQVAAENDYLAGIAAHLQGIPIPHLDQTHESDAALLRRLGKKYDAVATVKNGMLMFISINESRSASGKPLPLVKVIRKLGDHHSYEQSDSDAYSGVRAFWYDDNHGLRRSVVAGQAGNSKRLRTTYATEADARAAAAGDWQRLLRGVATFELTLAEGDVTIAPQSPVSVSGFKPEIDATEWLSKNVEHNINNSGFTTRIAFETKTEEPDTERELQHDPDEGITGVVANWKDKVSKKSGKQTAGAMSNPKTLQHVYASKASAKRAAKLEWEKIKEIREIIAENAE